MQYVERRHHERKQWVRMGIALKHIRSIDHGTRKEAIQALRLALADGAIPVRWKYQKNADDQGARRELDDAVRLYSSEPVPVGFAFWARAGIVLRKKLNKKMEWRVIIPKPKRLSESSRILLLYHDRILELWSPETQAVPKVNGNAPISSRQQPPAKAAAVREAIVKRYEQLGDKEYAPNISEMEKQVRATLSTARRKDIRSILREPQFAKRRRPRGNQRAG